MQFKDHIREALYESNAIEEVYDDLALKQQLQAWKFLSSRKTITPDVICFAHWLITQDQLPPGEAGYFRKVNVYVGSWRGAMPIVISPMIKTWCEDLQKLSAKEAHIRFEKIHPFIDGNGRTGRLLYYWMDQEAKVLTDDNKYRYYEWFN